MKRYGTGDSIFADDEKRWRTVSEEHVRMVYKCPRCSKEYVIPAEETSIPFCTGDDCNEEETEFERVEVLS